MELRERILEWWGRLSARRPFTILLISIIAILGISSLAWNLKISTRWSDLLPKKDPLVQEFESIVKDYTSTANSILVVRGPEKENKDFAEKVVPKIEKLDSLVKRIDYKIDEGFIRRHGLMLTKTKDLKDLVAVFQDLNLIPFLRHINDNFEKYCQKLMNARKDLEIVVAKEGMEIKI